MAFVEIKSQLNAFLASFEDLMESIFGPKFYGNAKQFSLSHPFLFTAITLITLLSLIPVLIFLGFATFTFLVSFICFLCIEGSLIVVGCLVLIGVISFIAGLVISILSGIAVAYFVIQKLQQCMYGIKSKPKADSTSGVSSTSSSPSTPEKWMIVDNNEKD